jgi:hypothetical protein
MALKLQMPSSLTCKVMLHADTGELTRHFRACRMNAHSPSGKMTELCPAPSPFPGDEISRLFPEAQASRASIFQTPSSCNLVQPLRFVVHVQHTAPQNPPHMTSSNPRNAGAHSQTSFSRLLSHASPISTPAYKFWEIMQGCRVASVENFCDRFVSFTVAVFADSYVTTAVLLTLAQASYQSTDGPHFETRIPRKMVPFYLSTGLTPSILTSKEASSNWPWSKHCKVGLSSPPPPHEDSLVVD